MGIRDSIAKASAGRPLAIEEASEAMEEIASGSATASQIAALAVALRMKGETAEEIAGFARVMRSAVIPVEVSGEVVDTCGTGGDGSSTFNISTVAALVASGAGARVAKHGNRAITSSCGSADLLEALGVAIELRPEEVSACVERVGIGFMFAPMYHPAMKYAGAPRREIGIRTIFNILGPLANPARASSQLLGVASADLAPLMGEVLEILGCRRALIVHGEDGLDEITLTGPTHVVELDDGKRSEFTIEPQELGLRRSSKRDLRGGSAADNAMIAESILNGERGARRDVVVLNAAAALYAAGNVTSLEEGIRSAADSIDTGAAASRLQALRGLSCSLRESRVASVS